MKLRWWSVAMTAMVVVAGALALPADAASPKWSPDRFLAGSVGQASVHVSTSGAVVTSWLSDPPVGDRPRAYVAVKAADGAWSAPKVLTSPDALVEHVFSGIGGRGRAVVVWVLRTSEGVRAFWSQHYPKSGWSASRLVPDQPAATDYDATSFDMSQSGLGVLAYSSTRHPFTRVLTASGRWKAPVEVSTAAPTGVGPGIGAWRVQAVIADDGTVTAAWLDLTRDQENGSDGKWQRGGVGPGGRRFAVASITGAGINGSPDIAKSVNGNAVAIYGGADDAVPHQASITYRLADGVWHSRSLPVADKETIEAITIGLTGVKMSVWWAEAANIGVEQLQVSDSAGGALSTSTLRTLHLRTVDGLTSAMAPGERLVGYTDIVDGVGGDTKAHDTHLRDWVDGTPTDTTFGPRSTVAAMSAAGGHAAFAWLGGPHGNGLRVRTR